MRGPLVVAVFALAFGFSGFDAMAAPRNDTRLALSVDSSPAFVAEQRSRSSNVSFVAAAGTIAVLAGAGLIGTLAAVGVKRVWTEDPILYPCKDGSL